MPVKESTIQQALRIKRAIQDYFDKNPSVNEIRAKDLMPHFIKNGIFDSDHRNGLPIRNLLRELDANNMLHLIPHIRSDRKQKNTNWFFVNIHSVQNRKENNHKPPLQKEESVDIDLSFDSVKKSKRSDSDESYIIDLCDEALGKKGLRQHKFDFLRGDPGKNGRQGVELPVDAYYKNLKLVIEYKEKQHTEEVKHFDKPDKMTVSGVHRGEQRKIYDQRRREVLPKQGIELIEISYDDFNYDSRKKIVKNKTADLKTVQKLLVKYIDKS